MSEKDDAIRLANSVLDDASRDPDDDLSMLSRQFLRSLEGRTSMIEDERVEFHIRVNRGPEQSYTSRHSIYIHAVMEAFGVLGLPYPCDIEIWSPDLVTDGYGPYFYRIDDFVDARGNVYGVASVMRSSAPDAALTSPGE